MSTDTYLGAMREWLGHPTFSEQQFAVMKWIYEESWNNHHKALPGNEYSNDRAIDFKDRILQARTRGVPDTAVLPSEPVRWNWNVPSDVASDRRSKSRTLSRLVRLGLITKERGDEERERAHTVRVKLTDKGRAYGAHLWSLAGEPFPSDAIHFLPPRAFQGVRREVHAIRKAVNRADREGIPVGPLIVRALAQLRKR